MTEFTTPHRRRNPLTGEWVLVSPHRATRPWQGMIEPGTDAALPPHDSDCYLCAGNARVNGERNPDYRGPHVFHNDFPALLGHSVESCTDDPLFTAAGVSGECRVLCFSERHDLTLPELGQHGIRAVVDAWADQYRELAPLYRWVQVFENKGAVMGCSNPHPHGQIWACDVLPTIPAKERATQIDYRQTQGEPLLLRYALEELERGERLVCSNDDWVVVVPWWATWPFETLLLPTSRLASMTQVYGDRAASLASILLDLTTRYDNLFSCAFPYSMGWHSLPAGDDEVADAWQLHAHFYPPLLRSADIRKFMVGFEMLAESQRDITPEQAAERLRAQSTVHYRTRWSGPGEPAE
ncbi:MAG: UDP-glucose--hexose-1-phosphate uridylyltransferase [Pseudomonadota bacterium]